jgi:serine/threonine-protein kinase
VHGNVERLARIAGVVAVLGPLRPPEVLGYDFLAELGRGATGTVFLARQRGLLRPVALKVLHPALAASPVGRARFRSEAQALARVRHPNVVQIFDVVDAGGVCAYAAEWVDGRSLAGALANPGSPVSGGAEPDHMRWIKVAIAIGRALDAVHQAGLFHRDLKPSNILLRGDGTPLLSDFGLAHEAEATHATMIGTFVGTVAYAAPEQLRGDHARVGARADVFGLGATLDLHPVLLMA